jgi:GGDEF domain-containing protein
MPGYSPSIKISEMDRIVNNLWLGSQRDADELARKNPEGITAILNVRGPDAYEPQGRNQSIEHPEKAYKWIPAPDTGVVSARHVKDALFWLREQTERGARILIHCKYGISRSPAFLAAFMVESGISASLEEALATISARRAVQPATQLVAKKPKPVSLVSAVTGLPNRRAFDEKEGGALVVSVDVDLLKVFNDVYGHIAGDAVLRRVGKILCEVGLDAYHDKADEFLCKGESSEALEAQLVRARKAFGEVFPVYADGRIQTVEGMDFSYGIGRNFEESEGALKEAKNAREGQGPPEWVRKILESGEPLGLAAVGARFRGKGR